MAKTITYPNHEYKGKSSIVPNNPVYEKKQFISGFLGFINTEYRDVMVSFDGYKEVWSDCEICGQPFEHEYHLPKELKTDSL